MSKKNKRINILNKCLEKATTKGISVNDIKFAEYMVESMNKSLKSKVGKSSDVVDVDLNDKCSDPGNLSLPKNYFRGFYPDYKGKTGFWKLFWSGWPQGSQKISCNMAKNITIKYTENSLCDPSDDCGGRAVELTKLSDPWVSLFGDWDKEYDILEDYLKKRDGLLIDGKTSKELASELRKNIWDVLSKQYAEYKAPLPLETYSIIVLPSYIPSIDAGENTFLNKTLLMVELPSLKCDRFSILFFTKDGYFYILGESGFSKIKINSNTPLKLNIELLKFNESSKKNIIKFLKNVYLLQKKNSVKNSLEIIKKSSNLFKRKKYKTKKRSIKTRSKKRSIKKRSKRSVYKRIHRND